MSLQAPRKTTGRPNHSHTEMTAPVNRHRCSMLISATISLGLFCVFQRCCLGLTIGFIKGPLCIHMKNGIYCCGVSCGSRFVIFFCSHIYYFYSPNVWGQVLELYTYAQMQAEIFKRALGFWVNFTAKSNFLNFIWWNRVKGSKETQETHGSIQFGMHYNTYFCVSSTKSCEWYQKNHSGPSCFLSPLCWST